MAGIENSRRLGNAAAVIRLKKGALATSGDLYRYLHRGNLRHGHTLNPKTGWSKTGSPLSVTVAAPTCIEAGIPSTLAMLQGGKAGQFLDRQAVKYRCYR